VPRYRINRLVTLLIARDKLPDRMTSPENTAPHGVIESLLKRRLEQVDVDLAAHLELFLNSGCSVWTEPNGKKILLLGRALVGQIRGLTMRIYSDENAPPHFHVKSAEIDAAFRISDCSLLRGSVDRKTRELIDYWYLNLEGRSKLIKDWNKTRPTDCPVGPIHETSN
jgi:hypothetical protein